MCERLRFFMQYPLEIRKKLLSKAQYLRINSSEVPIFKQGDHSDVYFVIVKGSVKIEQTYLRYKQDKDVPKIVIKSCYDGD